MKKLIYRKLLKDYMSFFFIALFSSSLIIWVFQAVNFLDIMIEDGREYTVYINYSLLNYSQNCNDKVIEVYEIVNNLTFFFRKW